MGEEDAGRCCGCSWETMEVSNHPRDDISPRPTLLFGARAANHTTAPHLAHPPVFVALFEPLPPFPSFLVINCQMPAGVMVFASCRVGGSRSLGLGLW